MSRELLENIRMNNGECVFEAVPRGSLTADFLKELSKFMSEAVDLPRDYIRRRKPVIYPTMPE
jgi:hypothetical protein